MYIIARKKAKYVFQNRLKIGINLATLTRQKFPKKTKRIKRPDK